MRRSEIIVEDRFEKLADKLSREGFSALPYHAGLDNITRAQTQEKFIRDEISVIVATIAFGMGIDKPDVRLIIHYDLPKAIEGYYQETGRAGRDNLPSECILFYSWGDKIKHDFFINQIHDPEELHQAQLKLREMFDYCELATCRRRYLLNYFGEQMKSDACNNCDICLGSNEKFDATEITLKIISAILRTGERYGATYISKILHGAADKTIIERGDQNQSVFGIAKDFSETQLTKIINLLVANNFLAKIGDQYPILKVTPVGKKFLLQKEQLSLPAVVDTVSKKKRAKSENLSYDQTLFTALKTLRKQLADERHVPPFVIFGDKSLHEMAHHLPQTKKDFAQIHGVGAFKLQEFADKFLAEIKRFTG